MEAEEGGSTERNNKQHRKTKRLLLFRYGVRLCFTSKSEEPAFETRTIDGQIMTPIITQC